jgi:heat shock protein HslJ/uncharacterized lipoprotein YbaY
MFRVITGVVTSFAGWAALVGVPANAVAQQNQPLIIKGSLTYLSRIALPPDSRAVVELRDATAPEGTPAVAEQHMDLEDRQVPVPFQLSVDCAKLSYGKRYVVRGAIVSGGRPIWASKDIAVDSAAPSVDVGMTRLSQVRAEPLKTTLMCGSEWISVSFDRDIGRVIVGGQTYEMKRVKAASGAKFEVAGDPTTSFWNKGRNGTLVVKGKTYPECTPVDAGAQQLQGGTWVVHDINGAAPVEKSRVTLSFGQDGRVSGSSSCNSYSGSYKIAGENLTIGQTIGTMKACATPLMNQEQAFLGILRGVQRFEIRPDGTLVLQAADKRSIAARRESPAPK